MENIERTQFVVLTGHTDEQPLPDLIRRLRVQRKTGRLQVEYADGPGAFFFEEGQMVDARLGELRGVEALYAALALEGGSFNFNPLVRPPERNIDRQGQQFIRDLVEAPRREGLAEIRVAGGAASSQGARGGPEALPERAPLLLGPGAEELLAPLEDRLSAVEVAIAGTARRFSRERLAYAVVIGFLVGLSLVTTAHILYGPFFQTRAEPAAVTAAAPAAQEPPPAPAVPQQENANAEASAAEQAPPVASAAAVVGSRRFDGVPAQRREYVVEVLVEVKDGRVADARVWNPRPGAAPFEAVALRMARERTYPETFTGGERLKIRVKP